MPNRLKKQGNRNPFLFIGVIVLVISLLFLLSYWNKKSSSLNEIKNASASNITYHSKLTTDKSFWSFENSGTQESIAYANNEWICKAGGYNGVTHYSRIKYKIPERLGILPTNFYIKATINLPSDFYTKQKAGFRILNTDNFTTTLNGKKVGAIDVDELRASLYIYKDHLWRVIATHENHPNKVLWTSTTPIPVGNHVIEFAGDVAYEAPWYLKVDGKVLASGTAMLSPDTVAPSERVITRLVAGIDGAAELDSNSMSVVIKDIEISNYIPLTTTPSQGNIDKTAPAITITSPIKGYKAYTNRITINTSAKDVSGISSIKVYIDNKLDHICNSNVCLYRKNISTYSYNKAHTITVKATDKSSSQNISMKSVTFIKL